MHYHASFIISYTSFSLLPSHPHTFSLFTSTPTFLLSYPLFFFNLPLPHFFGPSTPHTLQLSQHQEIRVQEPIYALSHTRLLIFIQFRVLDVARGYAFPETSVGKGVYSYMITIVSLYPKIPIQFAVLGVAGCIELRLDRGPDRAWMRREGKR